MGSHRYLCFAYSAAPGSSPTLLLDLYQSKKSRYSSCSGSSCDSFGGQWSWGIDDAVVGDVHFGDKLARDGKWHHTCIDLSVVALSISYSPTYYIQTGFARITKVKVSAGSSEQSFFVDEVTVSRRPVRVVQTLARADLGNDGQGITAVTVATTASSAS